MLPRPGHEADETDAFAAGTWCRIEGPTQRRPRNLSARRSPDSHSEVVHNGFEIPQCYEGRIEMLQHGIGLVALPLVLLGCSGTNGSPDANGSASDAADDNSSRVILLPAFESSPPPDDPHCACEGPSSQSPGGPESVACQASPSYCGECPIPFHEPPTCATVGLHCEYPETWCDCMAVNGGTPVWACVATP